MAGVAAGIGTVASVASAVGAGAKAFTGIQSIFQKYKGQAWTVGKSPTLQRNGLDPKSSLKFRAR